MALVDTLLKMRKMLGVVKFKKGYNADVIEYVGDFIKPVRKPVYKIYTTLKQLKEKIKR